MMEYKFRGKRIDNGEWVYGAFVPDALEGLNDLVSWGFIKNYNREIGKMQTLEVERDTVGQYTGLKDKNGKEIYEGDVVHCVSQTDMANMVIIWEEGEFHMVLCEKFKNYIPLCGFYCIRNFTKEVISNIHDNPELMEAAP
jgi:uncharacterized phage protein (TIGR01671 family)